MKIKTVSHNFHTPLRQSLYETYVGHAPHAVVLGFFSKHAYRCRGLEAYVPQPSYEELILREVRSIRQHLEANI